MPSGFVCIAGYQCLHLESTHVSTDPTKNYHELSLWTPLHQAAYMRAPVSVISQLIEYGAFRTNIPFLSSRLMNWHVEFVPLTWFFFSRNPSDWSDKRRISILRSHSQWNCSRTWLRRYIQHFGPCGPACFACRNLDLSPSKISWTSLGRTGGLWALSPRGYTSTSVGCINGAGTPGDVVSSCVISEGKCSRSEAY